MKKLFTLLFVGIFILTSSYAQYYQRYYNFDFTTPQFRDEVFNSGIKTVFNYKAGNPKNYFSIGIGTSYNNKALVAPHNRADRLRFVRNKKDGNTVFSNFGYEFDDPAIAGFKPFHSHGNSIAEINNEKGNGGYIAVGNVASNDITGAFAPGGSDVLYTHLDSNGVVLNSERIDFLEGNDIAWCVRRSAYIPGTFIICGQSKAASGAFTNCIVARLDAAGAIIWALAYNFDPTPTPSLSAHCAARQLCEDPATGNIYVVGTFQDVAAVTDIDGLAFALTSGGGLIWARTYNLATDDEFKADRFTDDGNIIVGGHSNYHLVGGAPMTNMLLTKIKAVDGSILFQTLLRATSPTTTATYDSKCFDLIESTKLTGTDGYYLVGPVYRPDGIFQLMYKTDGVGTGINNYQYNKMKIDSLFGIDLEPTGKKGVIIASSIIDPVAGFSDAHMLKTYSNGATCKDYCPKNPPLNIPIQMQISGREALINQQFTPLRLASKRYNYAAVLMCNQTSIACGAFAEQAVAQESLKTVVPEKNRIYPNPARSLLNIDLSDLKNGNYSILMTDMAGKTVMTKAIVIGTGGSQVQLDISHMRPGMYMVMIKGDTSTQPFRFVKE